MNNRSITSSECSKLTVNTESGFSLVEAVIALVILTIVLLGVCAAFTYGIRYNSGNNRRSQALSVLQREVESLRSAKFTPSIVDSTPANLDLTGGDKAIRTVTAADGAIYLVHTIVDDDPFSTGIQTNAAKTMKEITIEITPRGDNGTWITAYKTRAVFRRVRAN